MTIRAAAPTTVPLWLLPPVDPWLAAVDTEPLAPPPAFLSADTSPRATTLQRLYVQGSVMAHTRRRWRAPADLTIAGAMFTLAGINTSWRPLFRGGRAWGRAGRATRKWHSTTLTKGETG